MSREGGEIEKTRPCGAGKRHISLNDGSPRTMRRRLFHPRPQSIYVNLARQGEYPTQEKRTRAPKERRGNKIRQFPPMQLTTLRKQGWR
jgi:hypothetical protein